MNVRGLRWQVALVGIACGVLGVMITATLVRVTTRGTIASALGPTLTWVMERGEHARCEAAPARWSLDAPRRGRVFAYDPESLRASHPLAPQLRAEYVPEIPRPGEPARVLLFGIGRGGVVLLRQSASGPCGLIALYWYSTVSRAATLGFLALCGLVTGVFSAGVALLGIARPIGRRLARVGEAARLVGAKQGYLPAEPERTDDFGKLARELDRAHERIRADGVELERRREELQEHIADVAHDIRTPIASLQLALQEASRRPTDLEALPDLLARALEDVVYVGGLIGNLRLASELRERWDPPPRAQVALGETLERAVLRLRFLAQQKGISLEYALPDQPVVVAADPIALEQALVNIVENALVHGGAGGRVAALLERTPAGFLLTVLDDGPGVAPHDLPKLFERRFRSTAAAQRDPRGRGLGLAITHEICKRLDYQLSFTPAQPSGLRVTIAGPCSS